MKVAIGSASPFSGLVVRTSSGDEGLLKVCCRRASRFGHLCSGHEESEVAMQSAFQQGCSGLSGVGDGASDEGFCGGK